MKFVVYLSDYIIPLLFFYIIGMGILMKRPVYDDFIKGAKEGFQVVLGIMPTLIGLMVAIGILRASGVLLLISNALDGVTSVFHFPSEIVPLVIIKMFSSSAATSLLLDLFKEFGPDSYIGRLSSIIMSCTETIFYTMAVYYMTAGVKKTRYTLAGALVATLAGVIISTLFMGLM
ncbi:MAG TPA: spore maturation protein [Lachnoclostridium phytofermentans]|uniref:Nucleoside recognition domain protein n=2 Tax=Lachnoclostridium phytofermentans TaxID=66219 RepID=A9KLU5_LACP7|nr:MULTISPECIES: nucleoside recognition domain-containing protein [Lachnoclostridium]ABX44254.1 nucleoside recognition domain protein [Lachnoclostridium phytofermentans ISDg]HCL03745.1 spore maturation protein [Lachnoclostridium phytofermentans]